MVSIVAYTIPQVKFIAAMCFVFAFLWFIASYMKYTLLDEGMNKSWIILIGGVALSSAVVFTPMKIGTVAFVGGLLCAFTIIDLIFVFGMWNPFSVRKKHVSISEDVKGEEVVTNAPQ